MYKNKIAFAIGIIKVRDLFRKASNVEEIKFQEKYSKFNPVGIELLEKML